MYLVSSVLLALTALITIFVIKKYGGNLFKTSSQADNFFSEQNAKTEGSKIELSPSFRSSQRQLRDEYRNHVIDANRVNKSLNEQLL